MKKILIACLFLVFQASAGAADAGNATPIFGRETIYAVVAIACMLLGSIARYLHRETVSLLLLGVAFFATTLTATVLFDISAFFAAAAGVVAACAAAVVFTHKDNQGPYLWVIAHLVIMSMVAVFA